MEVFIGTIMAVGFNYAPRGWAFCNGQLLSIQQNSALFALLGTMYGGDGQNTFGLPDLRGRVIAGSQAAGPGLTAIPQGSKAGSNNVTVIGNGSTNVSIGINNLPSHTHAISSNAVATTAVSVGTTAIGEPAISTGNHGLTSTASGPSSASIFLPADKQPVSPINLGGVSTAISGAVDATGNGQPIAAPVTTTANASVMQPYTGLNYIIALEGIFPSRN